MDLRALHEWWKREADAGLLYGIAAAVVVFGPLAILAMLVIALT